MIRCMTSHYTLYCIAFGGAPQRAINSDPVADNLSINAGILKDSLSKIVAFLYPSNRYFTALANAD